MDRSYAASEVEQEVSDGFYKAKAAPPTGPWTFDADIANCFPDMLRRSIPGYETMRDLTLDLTLDHAGQGPVIDLGASCGDAVADLVDRVPPGPEPRFHLVETSPPMLHVLRERFLHHAEVIPTQGRSYRFGERANSSPASLGAEP